MGKQRLRHRKNPMFFPPAAEEWISLTLTCLCNILSGFPLFSCFLTLNQSLNSKPMVLNLGQFWPPGTSNNVWIQLWLSHSLYVSHIHRDSPEEELINTLLWRQTIFLYLHQAHLGTPQILMNTFLNTERVMRNGEPGQIS